MLGGNSKIRNYSFFSQLFANNGFYCITYAYDIPDLQAIVKSCNEIKMLVLNQIKDLQQRGYSDFSIFGSSMGAFLSVLIANSTSSIRKVILNTVGADLAEVAWAWDNTSQDYFKKEIIAKGYSLQQLKSEWKSIAAINNIGSFKNKQLLIYLGKRDELIPYKQGLIFVQALKSKEANMALIENKYLNHFLTLGYNLFRSNIYLSFLKD